MNQYSPVEWTAFYEHLQTLLSLAQTITFAVTAYWAIKYTLETTKIRVAAASQARLTEAQLRVAEQTFKREEEETKRIRAEAAAQAQLAAAQLKLAQEEFAQQQQEKINASYAYFDFDHSAQPARTPTAGENWRIPFVVRVAPVYGIRVHCTNPNVHARIEKSPGYFLVGSGADLIFEGPDGGRLPTTSWNFQLVYMTGLNRRHAEPFEVGRTANGRGWLRSPVFDAIAADFDDKLT